MKKIIIITSLMFASYAFASPDKPEANFDYRVINSKPAASYNIPTNKVEVIEFFSFTCGHCYAFDPSLKQWVEKNKQNIVFKRVAVDFGGVYGRYQKLFYTLEAMGKLEELHNKVFDSFHKENKTIEKDRDLVDFAKDNKLDPKQLLSIYHSFSVAAKAKQANKIVDDYKIDGVPTVLINGKYVTSSQMVGGRDEVLKVMTHLVEISKNSKKK